MVADPSQDLSLSLALCDLFDSFPCHQKTGKPEAQQQRATAEKANSDTSGLMCCVDVIWSLSIHTVASWGAYDMSLFQTECQRPYLG